MKPRLLPRDEIHRLLQSMPSALRVDIAAHIAAAHVRIAKLEAVAEAAQRVKTSSLFDATPMGSYSEAWSNMSEALAALESDS